MVPYHTRNGQIYLYWSCYLLCELKKYDEIKAECYIWSCT